MSYSSIKSLRLSGILLLLSITSLCAGAQVLRGNVMNGTSKKPAAGDEVILLKIDKGMSEEARTKSNARGEFSFQLPDSRFMRAVRVVHEKVSYYQPVAPGSTSAAVTVYEADVVVQGVHRTDQSIVVQAKGGTLEVYELFDIRNDSQPGRTQPTFSFYLPDGAKIESGEAMREGAMPLKSAPVPEQEKNKYLFLYPLIPGLTHFEVVYSLPYAGGFKFQPKLAGPVDKLYVVTPKSIKFSAESTAQYQLTPQWPVDAGVKNVDVHMASGLQQDTQLAFNITGEGVLQQDDSNQQTAAGDGQAAANGRRGEDERPGGGMGIPNERPNPLSQGQWWFLGILTLFLAGGAGFVFLTSNGQPAPAAPRAKGSTSLLDALKEEMFQLETERLHGKLSQQDYQTAKSVLDKTLQRAITKKR